MRTSNIVQNSQSSREVGDSAIAMSIDESSSVFLMDALGKLYSRPAQAVLREYLSNAIDAHKAKGGKLPAIQITLPEETYSGRSPLTVRDFGKGMSEEEFGSILSRYGASTKRDSNKMIGGFGLGAKAGFAVSEEFFMTSYQQGNAIRVRFFKDNLNQGYIDVVERFRTKEPDGVLVEIPIPMSNIPELSEHTLFTEFPFFMGYSSDEIEIRPSADHSNQSVHNPEAFVSLELGDNTVGWLSKTKPTNESPKMYGLVGKVAYSINLTHLKGLAITNKLDKELSEALSILTEFKRVQVIDIPIGSVDMPSAREEITYSERTMKTLSAIICRYATLLKQYLQKKLNAQKTKLGVLHFLSELQLAGVRDMSFLSWQGQTFTRDFLEGSSVTTIMFRKGQFSINSLTGYRMGNLDYKKLKLLSDSEDNRYGIFRITVDNRADIKAVDSLMNENNILTFLRDRSSGILQNAKALFIITTKDDVLNEWMFNSTPLELSDFQAALEREQREKDLAAKIARKRAEEEQRNREEALEAARKAKEAAAHASFTYFVLGSSHGAPSHQLAEALVKSANHERRAIYYWSEEEVEKFANVTPAIERMRNGTRQSVSLLFPFSAASLPNSFNAVMDRRIFDETNYFVKLRPFLRLFFHEHTTNMIVLGKERNLEEFKNDYPDIQSGVSLVKQKIEAQLAAPYSEIMIGYNTIRDARDKDTSELKNVTDFIDRLSQKQKAELTPSLVSTAERFKTVLKSMDTLKGMEPRYLNKLLQAFAPSELLHQKSYSVEEEIQELRAKYPLMMGGIFNTPSPEVVSHLLTYIKLCDNQQFPTGTPTFGE